MVENPSTWFLDADSWINLLKCVNNRITLMIIILLRSIPSTIHPSLDNADGLLLFLEDEVIEGHKGRSGTQSSIF